YLLATMFVALTDQNSGNSTPRCSKFTDPSRQLVITTSRRSQVTSSYGCTPGVVYTRGIVRPSPRRSCPTAGSAAVFVITLPFLLVAAAVTAAPILVLTRGNRPVLSRHCRQRHEAPRSPSRNRRSRRMPDTRWRTAGTPPCPARATDRESRAPPRGSGSPPVRRSGSTPPPVAPAVAARRRRPGDPDTPGVPREPPCRD